MTRRARLAVLVFSLLGLVALPAAARAVDPPPAPAPASAFDYTAIQGLSQPVYTDAEIRHDSEVVPSQLDGVGIYVEVTRPDGPGPYPVILEASPYHGTLADRDGTRILPEPRDEEGNSLGLTGYFAPRGYAVVMMDLRGTGRSQGCLDHLGPNDGADLKTVIEWAASQPWSNGRVGMTGHSYVGGTQAVAAAQNPEGLVTIVPSAGLASMYHHQFQNGVPYFLQWAGPMEAYEQIAIERHLPGGDNFGNDMEYFGCGLPNSSLTAGEAQLSGAYTEWHELRDWTEGATAADIPVFMVHGVNDNAARVAAIDWFTARRQAGTGADDKLWLGQWDHGSGCCPTRRGLQWTYALHAWFDRWLAQRPVDTGPDEEIFLSDGTFAGARAGDRSEILLLGSQWPGTPTEVALHPSAGGTLEGAPPGETGEVSFAGDPTGFADPQGTGAAEFATAPFDQDLYLAGVPELDLAVSVSTPRVHLITTLYDENPNGDRRRITQFAINPELRDGLDQPSPAVPGERYQLSLEGFAMGHHVRPGHRLVLRVTTSDPDKVPVFAVDPQVTVFTGGAEGTQLRLPRVEAPVAVTDDVALFPSNDPTPVGPAQPGTSGSVRPLLPGVGVRAGSLTSGYLEFDVLDGFDNATLVANATPSSAADVDLYLQQQLPDGSWSEDLAAAESSSMTGERLSHGRRLAPGRYRVEAHNWAGVPLTDIALVVTFFNQAGEPGT